MSSSARRKKISFGSSSSSRQARSCLSYASPSASAFWKIVGFEVTPVTASSSIIRASSPDSTSSRESVSNQTAWPRASSSCSRDLAMHPPFHGGHLLEPRDVARATVEARGEERGDELARKRRANDFRAEAEHVHVVVLDTLVRAVGVVADRGADPRELAGGDRGADAGAADDDPALGVAGDDRPADLSRLVGVVDPHPRIVGAEVEHVVRSHRLEHRLAQRDPTVVERDCNSHGVLRATNKMYTPTQGREAVPPPSAADAIAA